ncbi:MAG: aldehyde dehydrogenase family protein [Synechocystis sp.]|nr:aldehyde dehydrogenase family protein [Synechocystis sp.]
MLTLDFDQITATVSDQRTYFRQGKTRSVRDRLAALQRLKQEIQTQETAILAALQQDLHKPQFEGYVNEVLSTIREIDHVMRHLSQWVKPQRVGTNPLVFPATAQIQAEPLGVVLIISPWNYPFSLCLMPLIGAIAAGNCALVKPSELAPATSNVVKDVISSCFDSAWVTVMEGDETVSQHLLQLSFDHIFFTGSPRVGKLVMAAAAQQLTPVTLELGGKSPCIVAAETNLQETAKRIIWGKCINAGQTCVAPDYLLVEERCLFELLPLLKQTIIDFFGADPSQSETYCRIINSRHWSRLVSLLNQGQVIHGGDFHQGDRYFAPTLMREPDLTGAIMQEEIFGPILPILTYQTLDEAIAFVNERPKPLALYFFSDNRSQQEQILAETSSGGVCLNDILLHLAVADLPFGGVGMSGMGRYHGKASFDTFSHHKSILHRPFWGETNLRYPPYGDKLAWIKRLFA